MFLFQDTHTYIYIYIHIHVCVYIYICIYTYVYMYVSRNQALEKISFYGVQVGSQIRAPTQRLQNFLIKECTLSLIRVPIVI